MERKNDRSPKNKQKIKKNVKQNNTKIQKNSIDILYLLCMRLYVLIYSLEDDKFFTQGEGQFILKVNLVIIRGMIIYKRLKGKTFIKKIKPIQMFILFKNVILSIIKYCWKIFFGDDDDNIGGEL